MSHDPVSEFTVTLWSETDKAILVGDKEEDAVWIPKSICEEYPRIVGIEGSIIIPEWKAREIGWE